MTLDVRVIELEAMGGAYNTQIDEAILKGVIEGTSPPTVLFSTWKPTVSIGNSQSLHDVDIKACKQEGIGVVRRRSGGQAVYLDEGYIVFSVMGQRELFPKGLDDLRREFCEVITKSLVQYGVPASFAAPDNVVIQGNRIRTIANSAQILRGTNKAVLVHGSIRYSSASPRMTEVLRINKTPLQAYTEPILSALSCVQEHSKVSREELIEDLGTRFAKYLGGRKIQGTLHETISEEPFRVEQSHYKSRGICYLFVGGKNIVPEIQHLLAFSKPSTPHESVYRK